MKKSILYLSLFVFASQNIKAQVKDNLSLGPIVGFGHSYISRDKDIPTIGTIKFKPLFNIGARLAYSIHPHLGISTDLTFRTEGIKIDFSGSDNYVTTNLNYLRLDPKLFYFFGKYGSAFRPKIGIGPSLGLLVSGKVKTSLVFEQPEKITDLYRPFDLGLSGALGFNYRLNNKTWLNVDAVYNQGLSDATKDASSIYGNHNKSLLLNVGVTFGIGHVKTKN